MNRRRKTRATTGPSYRERYDALRKKQDLTGQEQEELLQLESTPFVHTELGPGGQARIFLRSFDGNMHSPVVGHLDHLLQWCEERKLQLLYSHHPYHQGETGQS